jgi:hypothetical protein
MNIESVIEKCKALKLKAIASTLNKPWPCRTQKLDTASKIDQLFELELELRKKNRIERCFKQSRLYENDRPSISSILPFTAHGKIRRAEL